MFLSQIGRIYYVWFIDERSGKRNKISTRCSKKSDALKFLSQFPSKLAQKKLERTLLSSYAERYLEFSEVNHSENNTSRIEYVLLRFQQFISDRQIQNIKSYDIESYKAFRLQKVCPVTVNLELRTLKSFFNQAVKWDLLQTSPFKNIKFLRIPERSPMFITKEEFSIILSKITTSWMRSVVIFAVNTGMRRAEVINLQWENVDLERNTILVANSGSFKTKSGRQRIVPMNALTRETVLAQERISPYVFVKPDGQQLYGNYVCQCFRQAVLDAKLTKKVNFHSLRHTFASWLVQSGVGIFEVQKLLGHSTITMTMRYAHLSESELHGAVDRIRLDMTDASTGRTNPVLEPSPIIQNPS